MEPALILGSQSPRRREILSFFSVPFVQVPPHFEEEQAPILPDPVEYAVSLARGKAVSLQALYPGQPILGADTVVYKEGRYYAKPCDRQEAERFLKEFSGQWQTVITALALNDKGHVRVDYGLTQVLFNHLSKKEIDRFLDGNIWQDKAGGYSIIGSSSLLVERIEGCFYNVLGLPVNALKRLFIQSGYPHWVPF